jgi:hypothetical protein
MLITGYFLFKFFKNEYSLEKTIINIKSDFKKLLKCCINKKNIEEKFSKERANEIELEMNKLNETENCKEPFGVPLDICLDGTLSKEEIIIREKVLKIINKKDFKVQNGGKDKLVLPMEAILFLTKNLNPLVSEHGEITIKMSSEFVNKDNIPSEELEKLIIELNDKESLLYKDDEELLNSINFLIKNKKFKKLNEDIDISEISEEILTKIEPINNSNIKEEIIIEKLNEPDEEIIIEKLNGPDEEIIIEKLNGSDKAITEIKKENNLKENVIQNIKMSPFDESEEINDFNSLNNSFNNNEELDFNDILMNELNNINLDNFNDLEEEQDNKKSFYKEIDYKTVKNIELDFEHLDDSINLLFNKDESYTALFRNITKCQPIVFNGNKTVTIVDQNIILFAISKMFGMESKTYLEQFQKLNKEALKSINLILEKKLELYLSDLLSGSKKANFYLLKDKNNNLFYTFAFVFQTNAFKTALNPEKFDLFRSFPYSNDYQFHKKASVEDTKNSSKLILDIKDVEIK